MHRFAPQRPVVMCKPGCVRVYVGREGVKGLVDVNWPVNSSVTVHWPHPPIVRLATKSLYRDLFRNVCDIIECVCVCV